MTHALHMAAVVTGSTRGIGRSIAVRLIEEGYKVVLNYAGDDEQAQETLRFCQQKTTDVLLVKADVSRKSDADRLMQTCVQAFGTLDVLINNAACVIDKPFLALTEEDWDTVVDTDMKGTFLCSQAAAAFMLKQDQGGTIINVGASTGIRGRVNGVNTCASKAGIMVMTKCLALELGPKIRVNTIIPGLTLTEETRARFHLDDPEIRRGREAAIPLQRIGTPEDVAGGIILLLSNEARFINGSKLVIDGGQYMW